MALFFVLKWLCSYVKSLILNNLKALLALPGPFLAARLPTNHVSSPIGNFPLRVSLRSLLTTCVSLSSREFNSSPYEAGLTKPAWPAYLELRPRRDRLTALVTDPIPKIVGYGDFVNNAISLPKIARYRSAGKTKPALRLANSEQAHPTGLFQSAIRNRQSSITYPAPAGPRAGLRLVNRPRRRRQARWWRCPRSQSRPAPCALRPNRHRRRPDSPRRSRRPCA